jgi:hypothetical protein
MAATPSVLFAQAVTGTLLGTVTDSTGAVVAGAKVTVTNQNTGFTRTVKTDAVGEYTRAVDPDRHLHRARRDGRVQGHRVVAVEVGVDQRARIDLKLEVGAMTESVTIEAQSPLVQTSSSELGTTVKDEQIEALPLERPQLRQPHARRVPGVLRGIPAPTSTARQPGWRASASFSANGQRSRDNNYMLDGVDNNETWLQTVVIFPSVDALDEFKLQTSTYSAEFGRRSAASSTCRSSRAPTAASGSALRVPPQRRARRQQLLQQSRRTAKPDFTQNQFGGTLAADLQGQDVLLRRLPGTPEKLGHTFLSTVPSNKMAAGDFSEISRVIYDPATGQPFPANSSRATVDDASTNILRELYPAPNTAGTIGASGQPINNYLINPVKERQDNQFD